MPYVKYIVKICLTQIYTQSAPLDKMVFEIYPSAWQYLQYTCGAWYAVYPVSGSVGLLYCGNHAD